jgi:hypothetical protein
LNKLDKDGLDKHSSPKKGKTMNKRLSVERRVSNIEAFIEDNADFEMIYFELVSKDKELHSTVLT